MSDSGVRDLPSSKGLDRRGLLNRLRYLPLVLLFVFVLIAGGAGAVVKHGPQAAPSATMSSSPSISSTTGAGAGASEPLPASCTPAVEQDLDGEPWLDPSRREASEAAFQAAVSKEQAAYIEGRDGWLFYNDWQINDFSQALGRVTLDDKRIAAWNDYLTSLQRTASEHGSTFVVVVAPGKWDVYPERLPKWADGLRGTNSLDLLMKAHPELPFIDTRAALRDAGQLNATYSPLNSHWTYYGGYVAWGAISSCLGEALPALEGIRPLPIDGVSAIDDFNEYVAQGVVPRDRPMWTVPDFSEPLPAMTTTSLRTGQPVDVPADNRVDMTVLPVQTTTENAQSSASLLVLRDSTGNALSPLWSASFAKTYQHSHNIGSLDSPPVNLGELLDKHPAEVTMLVMTERYLGYDPPSVTQ